jgi:capsule polysaccharide export protein KpsE/RkpR
MLPPASQQQSNSASALAALGSLGNIAGGLAAKTPDELYVGLLKSDTVWRALDAQFDLKARYRIKNYEDLRRRIPGSARVTSDKKSGLITVEVDDKDPKFAADLANAHAVEITKLLSRLAVSEAQQRRMFFEQQLKDTKENLINAEQALRLVQEKSGMVVLDKQAEAIITSVAQLKSRIADREVRLRVLRTATTAENPDVRLLNSELAAMRSELSRMESPAAMATPGKADGPSGIDIPIAQLPAASVEYVRALREVKFQETMLASMLRQYEVAKMDEAKDAPALQQVDVALPPDRKAKPARTNIVLGSTLVATLLAGVFVVGRSYNRVARSHSPQNTAAWADFAQAWRLFRRRRPAPAPQAR